MGMSWLKGCHFSFTVTINYPNGYYMHFVSLYQTICRSVSLLCSIFCVNGLLLCVLFM